MDTYAHQNQFSPDMGIYQDELDQFSDNRDEKEIGLGPEGEMSLQGSRKEQSQP
jgi:hypothetical protein